MKTKGIDLSFPLSEDGMSFTINWLQNRISNNCFLKINLYIMYIYAFEQSIIEWKQINNKPLKIWCTQEVGRMELVVS